jgi:hypothetical protein
MDTYSREDFEQIASAIQKDVAEIYQYKNDFEAAALMYRLDLDLPERKKPSELRKRLIQIGNTARKLLRLLGVKDPAQAPDGPTRDVLQVLASTGQTEEDPIIRATARVGRLVEILDAVDASQDIERHAANGAKEAVEVGKLYVPGEHQGDVAVNDWIGCMLGTYQKITGKHKLGISVKSPRQRDSGKPTGPLIRFLQAAGKPVGIRLSAASLAGRIKDLRTGGRRGKK